MEKKTILAIHAHPDDIEILAGGTVAQLASLGHRMVMATLTPGDCGSHEHPPIEIAAIRRAEAAASAQLIGAEYRCLEFRDFTVFSDDPSRRRVTEFLRQVRPDLVLAASPVDYMADHETASQLVRDACFAAPAPNYATRATEPAAPLPAIPHLYFVDPLGGVDRENRPILPDFYVNITPFFATKRAMLAEHKSQRAWLLRHHGMDDYLGNMERTTRLHGERAGVEYAEGFRHYKGHAYPATPLLEELLGAAVLPVERGHDLP